MVLSIKQKVQIVNCYKFLFCIFWSLKFWQTRKIVWNKLEVEEHTHSTIIIQNNNIKSIFCFLYNNVFDTAISQQFFFLNGYGIINKTKGTNSKLLQIKNYANFWHLKNENLIQILKTFIDWNSSYTSALRLSCNLAPNSENIGFLLLSVV